MTVKCPKCEQLADSGCRLVGGERLQCPFCDHKFFYSKFSGSQYKKQLPACVRFIWGDNNSLTGNCIAMISTGILLAIIGSVLISNSYALYFITLKDVLLHKYFGTASLPGGKWALFSVGCAFNMLGMLFVTRHIIILFSKVKPISYDRSRTLRKVTAVIVCIAATLALFFLKVIYNILFSITGGELTIWEWLILVGLWGVIWRRMVGADRNMQGECILTKKLMILPLLHVIFQITTHGCSVNTSLILDDYKIDKHGKLYVAGKGDVGAVAQQKAFWQSFTALFIVRFGGSGQSGPDR